MKYNIPSNTIELLNAVVPGNIDIPSPNPLTPFLYLPPRSSPSMLWNSF